MCLHRRLVTWLCALLLLTAISPTFAQSETAEPSLDDVTGVWVGALYQSTGGTRTVYPFTMVLSQDGEAVIGTSFITLPDDPSTYGMMEFRGSFNGGNFSFEESEILSDTDHPSFRWCLKSGLLMLDQNELTGDWEGDSPCSPGQITIVKVSDDPTLQMEQSGSLSGVWVGILQQQSGGKATNYPFSMVLVENGSSITGSSFIALSDDPTNYGVMALEGVLEGSQFDFEETVILLEGSEDFGWCIKSGTLLLDDATLRGNWESESGCTPGHIILTRLKIGEKALEQGQEASLASLITRLNA